MRDNGAHLARILRVGLPRDKQAPFEAKTRVQSGEDAKVDLNFKDIVSKQGAEAQEQVKRRKKRKAKWRGSKRTSRRATLLSIKRSRRRLICRRRPRTSA